LFFKQKPAYEMPKGLEFRRVLFRSGNAAVPVAKYFGLRYVHYHKVFGPPFSI